MRLNEKGKAINFNSGLGLFVPLMSGLISKCRGLNLQQKC